MKRNLIALAVAGAFLAPAAAMADGSGIVLTGVVHGDIGFGREKNSGGTEAYKRQANIGTFATRWEIDGTEDLGFAQAIFGITLDQQFAGPHSGGNNTVTNNNQANNSNVINNRNSFLGLSGGFGTVKIGQNEHQYEIQQIIQDPDPASENTYSTLGLMTSYGYKGLPGFTRRDAQSVWYTSPSFGGLTVDLVYVTPAGGKNGNISPSGLQAALSWKSGFGLSVHTALAQYNDEGGNDNKNQAFRIGAGYGSELFQVDVFGEQLQFKDNDGGFLGAGDKLKRTNIGVSGALNFGQHHVRGAISVGNKAKLNGSTVADSQGRQLFVGYAYTLSKRTELQVNYGKVDNKNAASYNVSNDGNDSDRFGVGIRHTF
jgi:predicted porin